MHQVLLSCVGAISMLAALSTTGCAVTCHDNPDGSSTCVAETLVRYEGTDVAKSAAYSDGDDIRIDSVNGNVDVVRGSSSDTVEVTFSPFTMDKEDQKQRATDEINKLLVVDVDEGDEIVVKSSRRDGASGFLGADITVKLPSGFNGGFKIVQNNGSIDADLTGGQPAYTDIFNDNGGVDIQGAGGELRINAENGSTSVSVQSWSSKDGSVKVGNGDLSFAVAAGLSGRIQALAEGEITESIPSDWRVDGADSSKSYSFGAESDSAGIVSLETEFGSIALSGE